MSYRGENIRPVFSFIRWPILLTIHCSKILYNSIIASEKTWISGYLENYFLIALTKIAIITGNYAIK
jgi:hypothetical protein